MSFKTTLSSSHKSAVKKARAAISMGKKAMSLLICIFPPRGFHLCASTAFKKHFYFLFLGKFMAQKLLFSIQASHMVREGWSLHGKGAKLLENWIYLHNAPPKGWSTPSPHPHTAWKPNNSRRKSWRRWKFCHKTTSKPERFLRGSCEPHILKERSFQEGQFVKTSQRGNNCGSAKQ